MPRHERTDKVETVDASEFAKLDLAKVYNEATDAYPSFTEGDEGRQKALDWVLVELDSLAAKGRTSITTTQLKNDPAPESKETKIFCVDVGCAHGQPVVETLAKQGHQVLGVDISDGMLAEARQRLSHLPNAHFEVADIPQWEPPADRKDGNIDCVVTFYILGHLPLDDYKTAVKKMISWLKPQTGILVLGTVAQMHGWVTVKKVTFPHTSLSIWENSALVEEYGCEIVKSWEEDFISKNLGTGDSRTHQFICARKK